MDIGTLISRSGARFTDRTAVETPARSVTFGELAGRVLRLSNSLLTLGLRPGERVLDLQKNTLTALESDLAIRSAGLVRAALNHRLHTSDWERIAQDSGARVLIYDGDFQQAVLPLMGSMEHVICVGDGPGLLFEVLAEEGSTAPGPRMSPDTLCGLHYSSGTTGHPKGAQRTHRNWFASMVNMTHDVLKGPPSGEDAYVHAGPITHTSGLFILPFLVAGARQIILPSWDEGAFVDAVQNRGGTHTALVPTMVARLLSSPEANFESLAGLKLLAYAGAPMTPENIKRAHDQLTPNLVQYYGLVEAIPPVTILDKDAHTAGVSTDPDLLTSAGRPALGVEIAVVDEEGRRVAPGEMGEVMTRGDHVMPGYWNATRRSDLAKSVVDGWLHSGDLGRMNEDGVLWLVDRKGDMIISGGYNIYPREVEEVIATAHGVADVAVLGVKDADWGQRVVALVRPAPGQSVSPESVLAHCSATMASYKKPKEVRIVEDFPLNATGKVHKKRLRAKIESEENADD